MNYLLDTNAVVALFKGRQGFVARLRKHRPHEFGTSAVVVQELFYGAYKSRRVTANLARVESLQFEILDLDKEDARCAGNLRARLATNGTPIGPYDALIAGQALARDLTILTHNTREFRRVEGLRVEDWQESAPRS